MEARRLLAGKVMRAGLFILLATLCGHAPAQDADTTIDVALLFRLDAKPADAYRWHVTTAAFEPVPFDMSADGRSITLAGGRPEKVLVTLIVLKDGGIKSQQKVIDLAVVPAPAPGPLPPGPVPPGPTPPGPSSPLAAKVRTWLKAIPSSAYAKEDALKVAGVFESVGSQGSDPARNAGWTVTTFNIKIRDGIRDILPLEKHALWSAPFFRPLAEWQAEEMKTRGINNTDPARLAELWLEAGEAIREGVF